MTEGELKLLMNNYHQIHGVVMAQNGDNVAVLTALDDFNSRMLKMEDWFEKYFKIQTDKGT